MNQTILTITTLTTQGEGIARVDGKATFVPFTLPGETWRVGITEQKKNYDRALPIEMIERSEDASERALPPCSYYGTCGGCHLQHLPYENQLDWKRRWLQETFRRVGHLEVEPNATVASPPWEYRNKLTLSLRNMHGKIVYSFHQVQQPNRHVAVEDCHIAHPLIRQIMPVVLEAINFARPRMQEKNRLHPIGSRVKFRVVQDAVAIAFLETAFPAASADQVSDRIFKSGIPVAQIVLDESEEHKLRSVTYMPEEDTETESTVSSNSFYQVNDAVREKLYQHVLNLPFGKQDRVLDGYCGVGILTQRLAQKFGKVVGVEMNISAAEDAKQLVIDSGMEPQVEIVHQPLETFLEEDHDAFDCMVLNPPRAGLSVEVRELIQKETPQEIVIISCHPAALARDVSGLTANGYRIESIQPFDMFPQTFHLETVIFLRRSES